MLTDQQSNHQKASHTTDVGLLALGVVVISYLSFIAGFVLFELRQVDATCEVKRISIVAEGAQADGGLAEIRGNETCARWFRSQE